MTTWLIQFDDNGEGLSTGDIAELEGLVTTLGFTATISSAPVPAPRLEWALDEADGEAPAWRLGDFWVYGDAEGGWEVYIDNDDISFGQRGLTLDAAKSLAEKLNAVLSPPVGPQE